MIDFCTSKDNEKHIYIKVNTNSPANGNLKYVNT